MLLAADGVASRAIGRAVGSTTGTASKWRVRYAEKRLAGLDETGERGAEPKYTTATNKRIRAAGLQSPKETRTRVVGRSLGAKPQATEIAAPSFGIVVLLSERGGSWYPLVGHTRPNMRVD